MVTNHCGFGWVPLTIGNCWSTIILWAASHSWLSTSSVEALKTPLQGRNEMKSLKLKMKSIGHFVIEYHKYGSLHQFWNTENLFAVDYSKWRDMITGDWIDSSSGSDSVSWIWIEGLRERTEHLDIFLFPPITRWCSVSDVLFTGGRRVSDFSVLNIIN